MARKLTKKQRGFVKDLIKIGNGTKAALANYDTDDEDVAGVIASENLGKPKIQEAINNALPDDLLSRKHLEGLDAIFTDRYNTEEPDYDARFKYLDSAYKLKGSYAPEKSQRLQVNLNTSSEGIKELTELAAQISAKIKDNYGKGILREERGDEDILTQSPQRTSTLE